MTERFDAWQASCLPASAPGTKDKHKVEQGEKTEYRTKLIKRLRDKKLIVEKYAYKREELVENGIIICRKMAKKKLFFLHIFNIIMLVKNGKKVYKNWKVKLDNFVYFYLFSRSKYVEKFMLTNGSKATKITIIKTFYKFKLNFNIKF